MHSMRAQSETVSEPRTLEVLARCGTWRVPHSRTDLFAPLVFLAPIRFTRGTMDFLSMDGLAAKNGMIADNAVALLEVVPHDQGG